MKTVLITASALIGAGAVAFVLYAAHIITTSYAVILDVLGT